MVKAISILGCTGSIGRQTAAVASFTGIRVAALTANRQIDRLEEQARQFKPEFVAVYDEDAAKQLKIALADTDIRIGSGMEGLIEAATLQSVDCVVTAVSGAVGAFYIMDLDHFKEANDTYGHQCGDEILQKFSAALKEVFRQSDCIGRFGGDEFVVFIAGELTRAAVERKARQTLEAVRHIVVENADVEITASIGIAMYPEHGDNYDYLFNAADRALYQVKSEGRDGYSVASSSVTR